MKNLLKILVYVKTYWLYALLNVIFNIFSVLFSLASFALFIPVLQMLFQTTKAPTDVPPLDIFNFDSLKENFYYAINNWISRYGEMEVLMYIVILILVLYFLRNLFRYLAMFYLAWVRNGVVRDLRNNIFDKVLILPLSYYSEQKKGDIIARMTSDVQEVEWSIMSSLEMLFRDPIAILTYLITLLIISPSLTLFVLILLPVSGYLIGQIGKSLKRTSVKGQRKLGFLLSIIEETLGGLRIIKAFNAIGHSNENFKKHNQEYTKLMVKLYRKRDLASPLSEFLAASVLVVVLWFGGRLVLSPENPLDAAIFITYLGIFSQVIPPAKSITTAIYNVQKGAASVERIHQVLDAPELIVEKPDAVSKKDFRESIVYDQVSFAYEKEMVLKDINLTIEKGKTIALVGPSGGGKSTLVDLLPRFYDCLIGEIRIDGIPVKDLKIDDLRGMMGIVTQDTILFNDSIYGNITLGMKNVKREDVVKAAKVANAHEFIDQLENGYDTNIGDRGLKLSGGQRQRLSIARAVLKNPPIMILDEATSSLDTESERLVQEALLNLMKNRTSVVIAHRLSTIKHADEIIVVKDGKIVERGTHDLLHKANGMYRKLHDLQTFA
ncbi:MAG: ABC transporter ATP-binding protein/permease [Bacteroidales bacterium]|nr:ABC transporter ATP-binding protein/permease [Bacteroidales bacterium]MCF8376251.1 ABC transporter ATP-binding protein/permease [Bacteroidales bacterium]MCF8401192.1 ABC transporter ATP-binding protein/permease [Bacteroidales bacterium]